MTRYFSQRPTLAFTFIALSVIAFTANVAHAQQAAAAATAVATPPAAPAKADAAMELSALVLADNEATLSAQMAGKINKINFGIGQEFRSGAVLAEFDCAESKAKLEALNAEYLGARETHLAKLKLQGLGAAGDLEVTLAAAAGEKAKSLVNQQKAQMSFCTIVAPYAGRIVRLKARQAENVAPNPPVLEIVAAAKLRATVHVPSALAIQLKPGSPLSIEIKDSGRQYAAKVSKLNARVDGVSQSLEVEAVFVGNTAGLLPGMIGQAVFPESGKTN